MPDAGPQAALRRGGTQLHLQHGPIDLLIDVDGRDDRADDCRSTAFRAATERFRTVLHELVAELDVLRRPPAAEPAGAVAMRMHSAVAPLADFGLTSMAAVAGAVADEIGQTIAEAASPDRWSVNNGGDIAFGLTPGQTYRVGLVPDPRRAVTEARLTISHEDGVGGVATSGWRGRSQSFGIADAVTVAARCAAQADAAATAIANAVDIGEHPSIERRPASDIDAASDLGERLVTVAVGPLTGEESRAALAAGVTVAAEFVERGLIVGAWCSVAGQSMSTWSAFDQPVLDERMIDRPSTTTPRLG